jgi:hypothetical protein
MIMNIISPLFFLYFLKLILEGEQEYFKSSWEQLVLKGNFNSFVVSSKF